jgi:hypothetical protein
VCGEYLPVHLGDYMTGRKEIEVFCQDHLPDNNIKIFTLIQEYQNEHVPKNISDEEKAAIGNEVNKIRENTEPDSLESYDTYMRLRMKCVIYPIGWKMGIRYLTDNAKKHESANHPNVSADWTEDIRQ